MLTGNCFLIVLFDSLDLTHLRQYLKRQSLIYLQFTIPAPLPLCDIFFGGGVGERGVRQLLSLVEFSLFFLFIHFIWTFGFKSLLFY